MTNNTTKEYSKIDHVHCWDQKEPPACGIRGEHSICCLCEKVNPEVNTTKEWEEFDKKFPNICHVRTETGNIVSTKGCVEEVKSFIKEHFISKEEVEEMIEESRWIVDSKTEPLIMPIEKQMVDKHNQALSDILAKIKGV